MKEAKLERVPVEKLRVAKDNARKIDTKDPEFKSLVTSIRTQGITVPLKVRPSADGNYEIVYGCRRFAAAKQLGLEAVPCIVECMEDIEAHTVRVVENLQRASLTPLEEAEQINVLLIEGRDLKAIADALGKSVNWIYQRAQLLKLAPDLIKELKAGKMSDWTLGALSLLASMPQEDQGEIAEHVYSIEGNVSVEEVRREIARNVHALVNASWDLNAKVIDNCAACALCPKRTGAQPQLFDLEAKDIKKKDECLDGACWAKHVAEQVLKIQVEAPADKQPIFVSHGYDGGKLDLHKNAGKDNGKNNVVVDVLPIHHYRKPVGKEKGVEVICVETGRKEKIFIPKPSEQSGGKKIAADGTKIQKSMSEKQAALDLRRWKNLAAEYHARWKKEVTVAKLSDRFSDKILDVLLIMAQAFGLRDTAAGDTTRKCHLGLITKSTTEASSCVQAAVIDQLTVGHALFNGVKFLRQDQNNENKIAQIKTVQIILGLDEADEWRRICETIPNPKSWSAVRGKKARMK